MNMKFKNVLTIVAVSVLSAVAAIGLFKLFGGNDVTYNFPLENNGFETASYAADNKVEGVPFDFTKAAEKGLPAVVHIRSTVERGESGTAQQRRMPRSMDDFWEEFFGFPNDGENNGRNLPPAVGFGSGVVISPDGYIVTNNHVIEDASEINVTFFDSKIVDAKLIGTDPTTDIALLKVEENDLPYLKFADSDQSKVGQWVAAIGNPAVGNDAYTLKSTVTAGIISSIGRSIGIIQEERAIESFIQTDAVINRGNSGGALVNEQGNLVGVNTAITSATGVYQGYGFAVPANLVKKVVTDLKDFGEVQRALLGITYQDIEMITSRGGELDTNEKEGLLIGEVLEGSAADKAGLKAGDVIIEVDGVLVTDGVINKLQEVIGRKRPGDRVEVIFKRNGNKRTNTVTLLSADETDQNYEMAKNVTYFENLGLEIEDMSDEQMEEFKLDGGVRVSDIDRNGVMYQRSYGDITVGFVITNINGKEISNVTSAKNALRQSNNRSVRIEGFHESNPKYIHTYTFPITE